MASTPEVLALARADPLAFEPVLPRRYIPQTPTEKQAAALCTCDTSEVFYGGAAGGAKSSWLLMEALRFVNQPDYNALLLRRTFADLNKPEALIPRSKEWLMGTDAKWNEQQHSWSFPSGATVSFT